MRLVPDAAAEVDAAEAGAGWAAAPCGVERWPVLALHTAVTAWGSQKGV